MATNINNVNSQNPEITDLAINDEILWQTRIALHCGDYNSIEKLKTTDGLTRNQKLLIESMALVWSGEKDPTKTLMKTLKSKSVIDLVWTNFLLYEISLSQDNKEDADRFLNFAIRLASPANKVPQYINQLLNFYYICLKFTLGENDPDNIQIDLLINYKLKRVLVGYGWYLRGMVLKDTNPDEAMTHFNTALSIFSPNDLYSQALVNLELGDLETNKLKAAQLLTLAEHNFNTVRKSSFALKSKSMLIGLKQEVKNSLPKIGDCVFISKPMQDIQAKIMRISQKHDFPVLILGERGTGKEMIAQAIHIATGKGGIVAINCAAIEDSLLQAELFGCKKGAFTGADKDKAGLVEQANGGTLFLDEVADLSLACQAKLLRLLQNGDFRRLGETQDRLFRGRVVAATNKDLKTLITEQKFRADLYDRLNGWIINLPPLRQRKDEILPLAEYFLRLHGEENNYSFTKSAQNYLLNLDHSANVRGLERTIERAIQIAKSQSLTLIDENCFEDTDIPKREISDIEPLVPYLDRCEKDHVLQTLNACSGSRLLSAKVLQVSKASLFRLLQKHSIKKHIE